MRRMQLTLQKGYPNEMHKIVEELRRCRTLLDEHSAIRLYGRTDDQPYPSEQVAGPSLVEEHPQPADNTPLIHYPLLEKPLIPRIASFNSL